MFKIKNLTPYQLDDTTGELKKFQNEEVKITINGCHFTFSDQPDVDFRICCDTRIKDTACDVKVKGKYVYLICNEHCTEETYVSLKLWQNILFNLNFINYKTIIKAIFNFIVKIGKQKWVKD